ncbi:uncharacterized protein LOC114539977 [Dendronephthya gigantea]|uniref:uncharacterized protein LOC114539977 n=1 Tax=Dendronephthya gigantea TaxID=151771 RepID=UPI00106AA0BC|nr:uncharacterized protein LOC114539977 [Dendronephthya gigantea]
MSGISRKRAERGGHRAYVTRSLARAKTLVEEVTGESVLELNTLKLSLSDKRETIKKLDEQILGLIEDDGDVEAEIESASKTSDEIYEGLAAIEMAIKRVELSNRQAGSQQETSRAKASAQARVKLPKLEVRKFSGKVQEWPEFWDAFSSAIHENESLSDVDKFTYLRGLLQEPAKSAIAGFALTSINYEAAVKLLERRFGNKTIVQRAYINDLLNLKPVFNGNDTERLRKFFDVVETNYRGLEALGVKEEVYSEIVVPSILNKLPEVVRLTITRGEKYMEWTMNDVVKALLAEIELRECHDLTSQTTNQKGEYQGRRRLPGTINTLLTKKQGLFCAYCTGNHKSEECRKVTDRKEKLELLRKFNRCFKCINKGHVAKNCRARNSTCHVCGGPHHVSICEKECEGGSGNQSKEDEKSREEHADQAENGHKSLHVGTSCRVALQTAQGILKGEREKRVRVLFDSGSQKSFVTSRAMNDAKLRVIRNEWLAINTFGTAADKGKSRKVVDFEIVSKRGDRKLRVEALVVPEISRIRNEHLEVVKGQYPHLQGLWLSDVCKTGEMLEIDVLIGADNLWAFQSGKVLKGGDDEPVAVDTMLGWVISGPLLGSSENEIANVNLVSQGGEQNELSSIGADIEKLWDLDTLGVKECDDVHEALLDKITFNGSKYSVKLPWKQGHDHLPSNYSNSLARMKDR